MPEALATRSERLQGAAARALGRLPCWLQVRLSGRPPVVIDEQTLDPQVQLLLAIMRWRDRGGLCPGSPAEARARFRREMRAVSEPKTSVGAVRDFEIPGEAGPLPVRHYAPHAGEDTRALLVYLHGGGFVIGDLDTHDEACRLLCRHAGTHVLSVDYRLAPEHPFPAAVEDTLAALEGTPPAAQLLIYPTTDAQAHYASKELFDQGFFLSRADCDTFYRHYTGGTGFGHEDPRVSPLRAPLDQLRLPPALVVTAGFDVLRDEGEAYAAKLREAKTTVRARRFDALGHGFVNTTCVSPAARRATIDIARDWLALTRADGPAPSASASASALSHVR
ncbi:MAG TPA: alpha/beta hydrolase fold domain-containing protein [Pyrinomonadaceae bacterium]|nr:alpha/beta hydrolase fold domain-containing protein [Pyrinomonadaceae bacterium]